MSEQNDGQRKLRGIGSGVTKRVRSAGEGASKKARSAREAAGDGAAAVGDSRAVGAIKSAGGSVVEGAGGAASRGSDAARGAAKRSSALARGGLSSTREKIPWDSVLPEEARNSVLSAVESSRALSADAKRKITNRAAPVLSELFDKGKDSQAQILSILQGLLASSESSAMVNSWLQDMVSGKATIYDQAMDAVYNATGIGGADHRLYDGGHSLLGAFQAVREASSDDSIFEEAAGLLQALARDGTTPKGLPLVTWDQDTFSGLADSLGRVGIPREWVKDMVSYDAAEVIGASVGVLAIVLNWNNDDVEQFAQIVGGMGLASVVSANPLLLIVTVVALAKVYHTARKTGDWKEFADGLARGGVCTGAVILVTSLMGGPAVVVLLTGLCAGVVAQRASREISIVEIGQWAAVQLRDARAGAKLSIPSPWNVVQGEFA